MIFDDKELRIIKQVDDAFHSLTRRICNKSIMSEEQIDNYRAVREVIKCKPTRHIEDKDGKIESL